MGKPRTEEQILANRAYGKKWRKSNPVKASSLNRWNQKKWQLKQYGLTPEMWQAMIDKQGGMCAICKVSPATHVDHCHVMGTVRGGLCLKCNAGIGLLSDDSVRLRSAVAYLEGGYC